MRVLELFAGSRSIGKVAEAMGIDVFSSDINPFEGINLAKDILDITRHDLPFVPDIIWASPPCETHSIAACSHHRSYEYSIEHRHGKPSPKSEAAKIGDAIAQKTLEIISWFPDAIYFIENPRGLLRKQPYMKIRNVIRHTVTYCQYGDTRMKPTDIWTNCENWEPRPKCKNSDSCHAPAPRGSRTGTQGLKGAYDRSKIPPELCQEVLIAAIKQKEQQ
jgi:hypothetical protein